MLLKANPSALLTDLYELTMACAYWKSGTADKESVFHLFFRTPPFQGGFTIACGLADVIDYLSNFHFEDCDISYLATIVGNDKKPLFDQDFLNYLRGLRLTCHLDAVPK